MRAPLPSPGLTEPYEIVRRDGDNVERKERERNCVTSPNNGSEGETRIKVHSITGYSYLNEQLFCAEWGPRIVFGRLAYKERLKLLPFQIHFVYYHHHHKMRMKIKRILYET